MNDKKGDVAISTLVVIILAIVVLVLVVVGFTQGWSNFSSKINIFSNKNSNVGDFEIFCQQACALKKSLDYCSTNFTLEHQGYISSSTNCNDLSNHTKYPKITLAVDPSKPTKNITIDNNFEGCIGLACQ